MPEAQREELWQHGAEWPDPKPIQATLHPVPAFDADTLLPEALRAWIMDEANRMPCPPDFIAAAALVAIGSIIGARCSIKPKSRDDWLIVPNLWGGMVGPPSAKKSPAVNAATKPLGRLIAAAMKEHEAAMEAFEAAKVVFEAEKEAIESRIKKAAKDSKKGDLGSLAKELQSHRQQPPEEPILRRYKTNDTTVEKLGELLRDNPTGLLVLRDELVGLVASWEREGHEGDRAFFLEAWNGNASFDTDRIKRGSIFIPNLCVSIFGGIQPDKLTAYLEQAAHALANDGMLQRFQLLVYPDQCAWEWRDRSPNRVARDAAFAVFEKLADFNPMTWGAAPADDFNKFPHFRFDDAALEIFIEWSGDLHRSRLPAEEHPIIAQHLAKFDKLMPALALILHLSECAAT
ncbi:MAG: YfjI family protein, partial [Gammaproteobacteria bacterium]